MKRLQYLYAGLILVASIAAFASITPRVLAADVIIHLGGEVVAPAPNPPVYTYTYYPDEEVYFVPDTHVYWWLEGGTWHSGPRVPEGIHLGASVNLRVDGRDPWRHHEVIVQHYPRHDRH